MKPTLSIYPKIPKERKIYIKKCMSEFDKKFTDSSDKSHNKTGIPLHMAATLAGFDILARSFLNGDMGLCLFDLFATKINLDYITLINNINKKKAAAFVKYMKGRNIIDEKELLYGTKKYLINAGSYSYPIFHSGKTKRIAQTGEPGKLFETGLMIRSDKKDMFQKFKNFIKKKPD